MTDPNIDTLARTLWGEARGEEDVGMSAVAQVVMNRCAAAKVYMAKHGRAHPLYGDGTPASACKVPYQFSCWLPSDPNREKLLAVDDSDPQFAVALQIADTAVNGALEDTAGVALYYKTNSLPWPAAWGEQVDPLTVIGNQSFYVLKQ